MKELNLLAIDIGASNGRGIWGRFDGETIELTDVHRFENGYIERDGLLYWDINALVENAKLCIKKCAEISGSVDCFGIDTWGVDYGLIDSSGELIGDPRCYRSATEADAQAVWERVGQRELFEHTGIAHVCFNTAYQLYRRVREGDAQLSRAKTLLMMPDLIGYLLTGAAASEYTEATTTMLYDPIGGGWDESVIRRLGIPLGIFTKIDRAGSLRGSLKADIAQALGVAQIPFAAVGTHDTSSAVAAIPGEGSFAFISSGTWSLFGTETDAPLLGEDVYAAGFSNEGTVQGGFRPLKNIIGMWLIQECRREWLKTEPELSWDDIVARAREAKPFESLIDPEDSGFFAAGNMPERIRDYCRRSGQIVPQSIGQIARCVYESLALKYRWATERIEEMKGKRIDSINIVGGGAKNRLLNQMTADASGRRVVAGPYEGTALGNLLMQAAALGAIDGIEGVRRVVKNSVKTEEYLPSGDPAQNEAYSRFLRLCGRSAEQKA